MRRMPFGLAGDVWQGRQICLATDLATGISKGQRVQNIPNDGFLC